MLNRIIVCLIALTLAAPTPPAPTPTRIGVRSPIILYLPLVRR